MSDKMSDKMDITGMPLSTVRRYMAKICELGVLYSEEKTKIRDCHLR